MLKKKSVEDGNTRKKNHKRITFKLHAPEARSVLLAGDFNSWEPEMHPLKKSSNGLWKKMISLAPGRYEYRFVVDGEWQNESDRPRRTVYGIDLTPDHERPYGRNAGPLHPLPGLDPGIHSRFHPAGCQYTHSFCRQCGHPTA